MQDLFEKIFHRQPFPKIVIQSAILTILFFANFDRLVETGFTFIALIQSDIILLLSAGFLFTFTFYILLRHEIYYAKKK
ncbi:MAG TPA: hypothetical protein VJH22_05825 [Candidatus Nanoarchaeia archaeon]|nr:hypothetical protein [Candidatus Nanoarchaeia archaeon]